MPEDPRRLATLQQSGRSFEPEELEQICWTVESFPSLSRTELAQTLCEHLKWRTATGSAKLDACRKLLEKLEKQGRVRLPAKRACRRSARGNIRRVYSRETEPGEPLEGRLEELGEVKLEIVDSRAQTRLWAEYVDRYHYLGYRRPFGCAVRYFVRCEQGLLGCVLLAGAAKAVTVRDRWIGWNDSQRLQRLAWVVNNTRFLIFPWIRIRHLASHVLGQLRRRVREDWQQLWGYQPVLLETFVDPQRFHGTCYRAAGWIELGLTTGEGLRRPGRRYTSTPKRMFVRPVVREFRRQLCVVEGSGHE
ncbi:MAG: DUF4338 domain-containing protein [bacterium]|nr:DUF4338 domain-containing protein [bacterium]